MKPDLTPASEALLDWPYQYHTPDCEVTAEDNCTCDLPERVAAIEAAARAAAEDAAERLGYVRGYNEGEQAARAEAVKEWRDWVTATADTFHRYVHNQFGDGDDFDTCSTDRCARARALLATPNAKP